jgi:alpha-tubulin suppressor-like RCC1 family protein
MTPRRAPTIAALTALLLLAACGDAADEPTAPGGPAAAPALAAAALASAFTQVSAGGDFNCGLTSDGRAYCWGTNSNGELGDGTRESRNVPTAVSGGLVFRNIAAGSFHTCGVTTDDRLYCWGSNQFGRLGDGTTEDRLVPTRVKGQRSYAIASVGYFHTCALAQADHRAFCWGFNGNGQLGDGSKTERHSPVAVAGGRTFKQLDAGTVHTCAVTPVNQAFCWGSDFRGELGDGGTTPQDRTAPSLVAGKHAFIQISAGAQNTCALTTAKQAFCWGHGPTGDGTLHGWYVPEHVAGGLDFRQVLAGQVMCGLSTAGKGYCWGFGGEELGDGDPNGHNDLSPVAVAGGQTFAQISVGDGACGRTGAGVIWCWGYGGSGALGDGSNESSAVPVRVNDPQG